MIKFLVIAAACVAAVSANIPVTPCNGSPLPSSFRILECETLPCGLAVGDTVHLEIGIAITRPTTALPVGAQIIHADGSVESFPLPSGDACAALAGGASCAGTGLAPGNYLLVFPITLETQSGSVQPGDTFSVRVGIDDQGGEAVACGSVTATIN